MWFAKWFDDKFLYFYGKLMSTNFGKNKLINTSFIHSDDDIKMDNFSSLTYSSNESNNNNDISLQNQQIINENESSVNINSNIMQNTYQNQIHNIRSTHNFDPYGQQNLYYSVHIDSQPSQLSSQQNFNTSSTHDNNDERQLDYGKFVGFKNQFFG